MERAAYWQRIYATSALDKVGWYERDPVVSCRLVGKAIEDGARSVIDVGAGASKLVDYLVSLNLDRVAVLDISESALEAAKNRLGESAGAVEWIVGDITAFAELGEFDVWHDRALFHFLTDSRDREHYVALADRTVRPGGVAVMATFGPDGPDHCSGLSVCRYGATDLAAQCGPGFELLGAGEHTHTTPGGVIQNFVYSTFRRRTFASVGS